MRRPLILASASPRRVQLLREAGFEFEVVAPTVDEAHDPSLTCQALTIANAELKARAVFAQRADAMVIGADTLVYIDDLALAKPADMDDARAMLRRLSGHRHQVCTGVAVVSADEVKTFAVITNVTFKSLTEDMIANYHAKVNVLDKAGGYALQEHGDLIVNRVEGSRTNVIGLPMDEVSAALRMEQERPRP